MQEPRRARASGTPRGRVLPVMGAALAVAAVVAAIVVVPRLITDAPVVATTASATPSPSTTPTPPPLTPSEKLLAGSADPAACAVSFTGDGVVDAPELETEGSLYQHLPLPSRAGLVFAGWYTTAADAAAYTVAQRMNGSREVACTAHQVTLHAAWKSREQNIAENARIPILMYHQFTTNPKGESGWLRGNYAYIGDFDAHMAHIASAGFYLPTWPELSAFIDGRLFLPNHSVLVTDDDADPSWLELGAPIVAKYKVLATSFVITAFRQAPTPNAYVLQRSHTHDMHKAGANGKGLMVNLPADQIAADLETSASILGAKEVVAYPFGHYNDTTKQGMRQAGFELGRTVEPGYVTIGTDKLALPVQRVNYGMGVDALIGMIG
jgi:hypothetical protein